MLGEELLAKMGAQKDGFIWFLPHWDLAYLRERAGEPTKIEPRPHGVLIEYDCGNEIVQLVGTGPKDGWFTRTPAIIVYKDDRERVLDRARR